MVGRYPIGLLCFSALLSTPYMAHIYTGTVFAPSYPSWTTYRTVHPPMICLVASSASIAHHTSQENRVDSLHFRPTQSAALMVWSSVWRPLLRGADWSSPRSILHCILYKGNCNGFSFFPPCLFPASCNCCLLLHSCRRLRIRWYSILPSPFPASVINFCNGDLVRKARAMQEEK